MHALQKADNPLRTASPARWHRLVKSSSFAATTKWEEIMNKFIVPVVIVATGMVAAGAWSQTPPANNNVKIYFTTPLENDAGRIVRLQSISLQPGQGNEFHRHPGDQWAAIQEGEVTFTIKGQAPRVLKAGDSVYIPRGTIHRNQNLGDKPSRSVELNIIEKDKPALENVTN
jgi:quercetin dioxygenase-like cupin family protein